MFEHSMKAPLIVAGPGIPAGKAIDIPVYLQDIMRQAAIGREFGGWKTS